MTDVSPALTIALQPDGVLALEFSRPDLLNRFDTALHHELTLALTTAAADAGVRAIALTSTGRAFSAGGDFELMRRAREDAAFRRSIIEDARRLLGALLDLPQPIVVGVQGAAMGLGATVTLACDAVVASRNATFADTHVNVGLAAGDGGCLVWPQSAGTLRARRHLLTGDPLDAETAYALGMVTDLVETANDVAPATVALAARIAALPPIAVQSTKRVLNRAQQQRAGEIIELSLALEEQTMLTDDHLEGIAAFQERRKPTFVGR